MKKIWLLFGMMLAILLNGCYSNFTGHMLFAPKTLEIVTPKGIQNNKVYEVNGEFYVKTQVDRYERDNNFLCMLPEKIDKYTLVSSKRNVWVNIPEEFKRYLCTAPIKEEVKKTSSSKSESATQLTKEHKGTTNTALHKNSGKQKTVAGQKSASSTTAATAHEKKQSKTYVEKPGYVLKKEFYPGDFMDKDLDLTNADAYDVKCTITTNNALWDTLFGDAIPKPYVKLQEKEASRYYLLPLALITFPADIVTTILLNVLGPISMVLVTAF